jgi:amino acid transporter
MTELAPPSAAPLPETHRGKPPGRLRANTLGTASIVFFVVAAASPLTGVAGGMPVSFGIGNGVGAASMYLLATLVLLVFSVGYAAMSRKMINAGAFYAYIGRGIGPWAGISAAFLAMMSYLGMMVAVYALFGTVTSDSLATHFGWDIPWWALTLAVLAVVAFFGHR